MAKFYVEVPFAGYVSVEVEADSAEGAIDKAIEEACHLNISPSKDGIGVEIMEWDVLHDIVRGNVCYAPRSHASAEEISDD